MSLCNFIPWISLLNFFCPYSIFFCRTKRGVKLVKNTHGKCLINDIFLVLLQFFWRRFDGADFLNRWKGKKIMFVGDSLSLNMWESLSCMIHASVPNTKSSFLRKESLSTVTFQVSFCFTFLFITLSHFWFCINHQASLNTSFFFFHFLVCFSVALNYFFSYIVYAVLVLPSLVS